MRMLFRPRRLALLALGIAATLLLVTGALLAADVITNGTMESIPIGWTWNAVSGASAQSQDTAQKGGGTYSLKGISTGARKGAFEWFHSQAIATSIESSSTATLSFWYGHQAAAAAGSASLSVELFDGTTTTTIWGPTAVSPALTFTSATSGTITVPSSAFPTTGTYTIRLRASGTTGNSGSATVAVWWDNVVLNVTAPPPLTTTVADGTDPAGSALCPTNGATWMDSFTLTSSRSTGITGVGVSLGAGAAAGISLVEVTNDAGTQLGSVSNPGSDTVSVPVSITSTTSATPYRIRITPKGHAAPTGTYTVTARVASLTGGGTVTNNDAGDVSFTIDNAAPSNATWGSNSAGDGSVTLNWTNPGSDFSSVVIVRSTTTPITAVPTEGTTYAQGSTIGGLEVRYAGNGATFDDTTVANGTTYYYKIFARDACGNYSAGVESAGLSPAAVVRTTTVGNGSEPGPSSACPGDAAFADAFTLQADGGSANAVSNVTVTFPSGASELALVEITSDDGNTVHGSSNTPAGNSFVVGTSGLSATTSLVQYKVRITPKSHSAMTAGNFSIAGTVTAISCSNAKSYSDASGSAVSIDNQPPSAVTSVTGSGADQSVTLGWTNPSSDFSSVVIVRSTTSPISAAPADGQTYLQGNTIGGLEVRYAGSLQTFNDTGLINGTPYYYKVFARDACGNYSTGVESEALTPNAAPKTTTIGDGTDPAPSTTCPGVPKIVDAFTLQTDGGSNAVTSVTVTLPSGAAELSKIEIVNDADDTSYGSVSAPVSSPVTISTSGLTATTSLVQYKVRVTPKTHAALAPGDSTITGTVTAIACTNLKSGTDTDGSTVTVDNTAPGTATWGTATPGNGQLTLSWSLPAGATQAVILRSTATPITDAPADGTSYAPNTAIGASVVRYSGSSTSFTDSGLANGTTYYYRIFAADGCTNYGAGVESSGLTPTDQVPRITVSAGTATADSCNQVTARVPHTGDSPANSKITFDRGTAVGGPWTAVCSDVTGASPRSCVFGSLTPGTTYWIRATVTDADGITGQNPQIIGPVTTPSTCKVASTTAGTATAQLSACRQIVVSAPFTGDGDSDGSVKVEFNTSNSWPGTTACATLSSASPRTCYVTTVSPSTQYWLRATYSDPDGVSGSATQVLGPLTTAACGADGAAPTILFLAPARGAFIGGTEKFKAQVWDGGGLAVSNPVQWSVDGGALSTAVTPNAKYSCGTNCSVYEFTVNAAALANGAHYVTVQATDAAGNVGRASQPVNVSNTAGGAAVGAGTLLRRTHSSQLCVDCHALSSHSSQSAESTKYGSWAVDCLSCHTPHLTPNIKLIRPIIETPNSGPMAVDLRTVDAGGTNPQYSLLGAFDGTGAPFNDGVCEVCHTKTTHYRNDASGGDHTHYQNQRCTNCHNHSKGFKGSGCNGCHNAPPTGGKHRTKHDEVWDSTAGNTASSYDDTASHATATQYGFSCADCHSGTHLDDGAPHDGTASSPWQVQVSFGGINAGGSYSGTYNQNSETGPTGTYFSWSNGTCSNGYCHSNASPVGGANSTASPTWNGAATTCTSCHKTGGFGDGANDNTFLSKNHAIHMKSASGETGSYAFRCADCHLAVVNASGTDPWNMTSADLKDKRLHVDGNKQQVSFGTIGTVDQSAGTYNTSARTCGSTYCHSNASPFGGTNASAAPAWTDTGLSCAACHKTGGFGDTGTDNTYLSKNHAVHIKSTSGETGSYAFKCVACHASVLNTVPGNDPWALTDADMKDKALHVNGNKQNVAFGTIGTIDQSAGTYNASLRTCGSTYCHSNASPVGGANLVATPAWNDTALSCAACHKTGAFGDGTNANTFLSKSHSAHIKSASGETGGAAYKCVQCHAGTLNVTGNNPWAMADADIKDKTLHVNGAHNVSFPAPFQAGTYDIGTRQCTVACHNNVLATWGGTAPACTVCHGGAEGDALGNGIPGGVTTHWATSGHGSGPGGSFTSTQGGCDYCHDLASEHAPTATTNPYRLRYSATDNTLCLKCHATGDTGINTNSAGAALGLENSGKNVDDAHFGSKHQAGEGGNLCWDCHDPHGVASNILMVRQNINLTTDAYGIPSVKKAVSFTARVAAGDFVQISGANPRTGICQACHDPGKGTNSTTGSTKYWRWDGTDATGTSGPHYSTQVCSDCHKHNKKFAGAGGNCLGCHGDASGAPGRRAVSNDFADGTSPNFRSHHVGNSTANTLRGTLSNNDCIVCHAEGTVTGGAAGTTALHNDGKIDLRNVDSTSVTYPYDKAAITASAGASPAGWGSTNGVWRTQTSTNLDPFCLSCHDSDGATQVSSLYESGATAKNPFKDASLTDATKVTNNYDQLARAGVVDIKSKVSGAPPAQGTFARHAIRGQSASIYTKYTALGGTYRSMYEGPSGGSSLLVQTGVNDGTPLWNDTSVMGCADCHTTDGANGSAGNAHGSSSEYLLKDASGGAAEGTLAGQSYVCYRCHPVAAYDAGVGHTGNAGDYQDYTANVGSARVPTGNTGGSRFGMACMNCHGGTPQPTAYPTSAANTANLDGYGWIHGTNQVIRIGEGTTTRNAYRFTNGGSMRFWDPGTWTSTTGGSCYTLGGSNGAADQWGGCTKHGRGTPHTRTIARPITY